MSSKLLAALRNCKSLDVCVGWLTGGAYRVECIPYLAVLSSYKGPCIALLVSWSGGLPISQSGDLVKKSDFVIINSNYSNERSDNCNNIDS